jgi:hypothetical protein
MSVNKYRNKKTVSSGLKFDSKKEAKQYEKLKVLELIGEISDLQTQVKFSLIPSQYEGIGKRRKCLERECSYVADFVFYRNGTLVVQDTKGFRTADYIMKRKLMLHVHDIRIEEI